MNQLSSIAIFIPTFKRPESIQRVIDNINENTRDYPYRIYFIVEHDDQGTRQAIQRINALEIINKGLPCYADCINTAYQETQEQYFFTGADDLGFHEEWIQEAMQKMTEGIAVVGTNDMGSIPIGTERDATHYLIRRSYIQEQGGVIDRPNTVLYPYFHNYTDKEFIETAKAREVYIYAPESKVEHLHWAWGKAQMDETYKKGNQTSNRDQQTYNERKHLWEKK